MFFAKKHCVGHNKRLFIKSLPNSGLRLINGQAGRLVRPLSVLTRRLIDLILRIIAVATLLPKFGHMAVESLVDSTE